jgi:hypothetical protein
MKRSSGPRTTANLSKSIHPQLNMYALAASAAGIGVLALTQPTEAKIVYTPTHHVVGKNGRYKLDLNNDKMADFILVNTHYCNTDYCVDVLSAIPANGNAVEGARGFLSIPYASALKRGAPIGPEAHFSGKLMASSQSSQGSLGRWLHVTNGYLGLKFTVNGKTHYGWARLTVQALGSAFIKATLTGYAYETIPGKSIKAGQRKGPVDESPIADFSACLTSPVSDMPQPASLGILALGAQGVPLWRRKESALEDTSEGGL